MTCKNCEYYGGFVKSNTTYSGLRMVCDAPKDHLEEKEWCYVDGAILPGKHCSKV